MKSNDKLKAMNASRALEELCEWKKWIREIPYVSWPEDWLVKAIPPFTGAIVRYAVTKEGLNDYYVSIYLDCYDLIGLHRGPYWEVYPYKGDVGRCDMADVDELLRMIEISLKELEGD